MNAVSERFQLWREWLEQFDPLLAQQLGDLLLELDSLLPVAKATPDRGNSEFDGFDGIINRGLYTRLLTSEWALAEVWPDEFLRRASMNEHLFFAPKWHDPRQHQEGLMIFDAGPHQLGAARIFHVAIWLVLMQRARQQGSPCHWAIAQQPGKIYDLADIAGLKQLLQSRSLVAMNAELEAEWQQTLATLPALSEVWWIGADHRIYPIPATLAPNQIQLSHAYLTPQITLDISAAGVRRQKTFAEPDGMPFQRLLKGHFRRIPEIKDQETTGASVVSLHQSIFASSSGQHVAVLLRNHRALVWRIPITAEHKVKRAGSQRWPQHGELLTGVFNGKSFGGLIAANTTLQAWSLPHFALLNNHDFTIQYGLMSKMQSAYLRHQQHARLYVVDHKRQLHLWTKNQHQEVTHETIQGHVFALYARSDLSLLYAYAELHRMVITYLELRQNSTIGDIANHYIDLDKLNIRNPGKVLLNKRAIRSRHSHQAWAILDQATQIWCMGTTGSEQVTRVQIAKKRRIAALIQDSTGTPALVVLSAELRTIQLVYANHRNQHIHTESTEITHLEATDQHLFWITQSQDLHIWSLEQGLLLTTISLTEAP